MLYLTIHESGNHRPLVISNFPATIGRSASCNVVLESDSISAHHAVIDIDGENFTLKDQQSTNGIYAGGKRVTEHTLKDGETIHIADVEIQVHFQEKLEKTRISDFSGGTVFQARLRKIATHVAAISIAWFVLLIAASVEVYLVYWPPEQPLSLLIEASKAFVPAIAVTFVISLIGKLTTKRFYYRKALICCSAIFALSKIAFFFRREAAMNLPWVFPIWWPVIVTICMAPLVYGALARPLQTSKVRSRVAIAVVLVSLFIGVDIFSEAANRKLDQDGRNVNMRIAAPWSLTSPKPIKTSSIARRLDEMKIIVEEIKTQVKLKDQKSKEN